MDIQINRLGKIQAEDSHDGFGIDYKSTSNFVRSFTKDFTLSIEFKEMRTVFMLQYPPLFAALNCRVDSIVQRYGGKVKRQF